MEISPFAYDPERRLDEAERIRISAAQAERRRGVFERPTNSDEETYANRIGNYSKGLPHTAEGEVERAAYDALLRALRSGRFEDFESVPMGGTRKLLAPLGGLAFNIKGPDSPATTIDPPPSFAGDELAGQMAEPTVLRTGSPFMPSYLAGHAITAGATVTILKAWFNEDLELREITTPDGQPAFPRMQPNGDGTALESYDDEGAPLTIGGELNKLAHNVSLGRDMSGVHWRADDLAGNKQGEDVAIRILQEACATYPESFGGFTLTRFDGTRQTIGATSHPRRRPRESSTAG